MINDLLFMGGTAYFNETDFNEVKNSVDWYAVQKDKGVFFPATKEEKKENVKEKIQVILNNLGLISKYYIIWDYANNSLGYVGEKEEIN